MYQNYYVTELERGKQAPKYKIAIKLIQLIKLRACSKSPKLYLVVLACSIINKNNLNIIINSWLM